MSVLIVGRRAKMAYDFNCPYCGFGHNGEDELHEDDWNNIGEFDCTCRCCKKSFIIEAHATIYYDTIKKKQPQ